MNRIHRAVARRHDGEMGFSLISVLVVVLILGVLSALAVAAVNSGPPRVAQRPEARAGGSNTSGSDISLANKAACEASATAIETAALAYYYGHDQTWPPDIAALTDAAAPYLRSAPNPRWGLVYDNTNGNVDTTPCSKL